jgi:hypothetical protein
MALAVVPAARAQDSPTFVVGTYYQCTQGKTDRVDAIYKDVVVPMLKAEVAAGRVGGWGWAKHWEGGEWRRLEYMAGTDLNKLVDAREEIIKKTEAADHKKDLDEFDTICPSHDDYIWSSVAGSQAGADVGRIRSPVSMSTYFVCDPSLENEADAIVKTAFAPILNRLVKDGKIASWNWLQHVMGGKYRRLLVFDGSDHKSLLNFWNVLTPALEGEQGRLSQRFDAICSSHTDYIWDMETN